MSGYRLESGTVPNCPNTDCNSTLSQGQNGIFLSFCGFQSIPGQFGILRSLRGEGSSILMIDSEASFPLMIPFSPGTDWNPGVI